MRRLLWLLPALWLAACTRPQTASVFLSFTETEPGGQPYPVRMLITDQYLRIEDGDARSGFVLFDRAARAIYSVSHEARSTLVVRARPVTLRPPEKFVQSELREAETPPAIDGRTVVHYRLQTNGETCFEVYAADGLLPQAVAALREYHEALAGEQARMQANVPAAFQSACDMTDFVFQPTRYLAHGFPVRQVNHAGVIRQLVDFKTGVPVEPRLFELPKEYKEITTAVVQRGAAD
jgi:hypothetical protein